MVHADDPAARAVAYGWFAAYARGDVPAMLRQAAFPFRSTSGVAAKSPAELKGLLDALLEESGGQRSVRGLQLFSPAGARGALGSLPGGFEEGNLLFGVADVGGDKFVLVLGQRSGAWKALGLVRR